MDTREAYGKEFHVTFNDKKTTGVVFGASNGNCKAIQVNGNNVDWVTNARHLGNQGSTLALFRYPEHPRLSDGIPDSPEK